MTIEKADKIINRMGGDFSSLQILLKELRLIKGQYHLSFCYLYFD